jgi:trigger factor
MNAVVETLPNCLATLRVELGADRVTQTRESLVKEFLKEARIPGFRPGKAPRAVVEKRFEKQIS